VFTLVLSIVLGAFFAIPPRYLGTNMVPEFIAGICLILAFQAVAVRISQARLQLGKEASEREDDPEVIRLLSPFLGRFLIWPNARFDKTGEGLWMLATALQRQGRAPEGRQLLNYIVRYRRGEFAEKAKAALERR
jgi:hypothetical protein